MGEITRGLRQGYNIKKNSKGRISNDFYPTPYVATLCLTRNYNVPDNIWEPCAGRGHIAKVLEDEGHYVWATDLYEYENPLVKIETGKDYLKTPIISPNFGIVTNPPFHKNFPVLMVEKAMRETKFLALFQRITFLQASSRHKLFQKYPPTISIILSDRVHVSEKYIDHKKGIGGMIAYCWYIWDYREKKTEPDETKMIWRKPSDYIKDIKPW